MSESLTTLPPLCGHCGGHPVVNKLRQLCRSCYTRWHRYGDPGAGGPRKGIGAEERFFSYLSEDDGCWIWTGPTTEPAAGRSPYAILIVGSKKVRAHRWSYEFFIGPIPEGLELDHLCRRTLCVYPWTLDPVPHKINLQRAWHGGTPPDVCRNGHERTPENTGYANGVRYCLICARIKDSKRYYANDDRRFNRTR